MKRFDGMPQRVTDEEEPAQEAVAEEAEGSEVAAERPQLERVTDDEPEVEVAETPDEAEGPSREEQLAALKAELTGEQAPEAAEMDEESIRKAIAENEAAMAPIADRLQPIDRLESGEKRYDREARALEALVAFRESMVPLPQGVRSQIWMNLTQNMGFADARAGLIQQAKSDVRGRSNREHIQAQMDAAADKLAEIFAEGPLSLPDNLPTADSHELLRLAKENKQRKVDMATELQEARKAMADGEEEGMREQLASMREETEELRAQLPPKDETKA